MSMEDLKRVFIDKIVFRDNKKSLFLYSQKEVFGDFTDNKKGVVLRIRLKMI